MKTFTLAVATSDGTSVCDHLARSTAFHVFTVKEAAAGGPSVRERKTGECGNHRSFVEMLSGCDAVICGGIGDGAVRSLDANGIRSVVTLERPSIQEAVPGIWTERSRPPRSVSVSAATENPIKPGPGPASTRGFGMMPSRMVEFTTVGAPCPIASINLDVR